MSSRTRPCDDAIAQGRLRKAEQFWDAAESIREPADRRRQAERILRAAQARSGRGR